MKKNVLIIFKYPHPHWNIPVINRFSNYYEVESLYINDIKDKNFTETVEEINNLIRSKNIEIAVFDVDYFKFSNFFLFLPSRNIVRDSKELQVSRPKLSTLETMTGIEKIL